MSSKAATGHLTGAAGAYRIIFSILAAEDGMAHTDPQFCDNQVLRQPLDCGVAAFRGPRHSRGIGGLMS